MATSWPHWQFSKRLHTRHPGEGARGQKAAVNGNRLTPKSDFLKCHFQEHLKLDDRCPRGLVFLTQKSIATMKTIPVSTAGIEYIQSSIRDYMLNAADDPRGFLYELTGPRFVARWRRLYAPLLKPQCITQPFRTVPAAVPGLVLALVEKYSK